MDAYQLGSTGNDDIARNPFAPTPIGDDLTASDENWNVEWQAWRSAESNQLWIRWLAVNLGLLIALLATLLGNVIWQNDELMNQASYSLAVLIGGLTLSEYCVLRYLLVQQTAIESRRLDDLASACEAQLIFWKIGAAVVPLEIGLLLVVWIV